MYTIEAAMAVSTKGGNHAPAGDNPYAEPSRVNECATVNAVTTETTWRSRSTGMTRQSRKSRWSKPLRMCAMPSAMNPAAAWYQAGFSETVPDRLVMTIALPGSPRGRYRTASFR